MTSEALRAALIKGDDALKEFGRSLASAGDGPALDAAARWLETEGPPEGRPWAAAYYALAKQPEKAVRLYERWLEDAEAPAAQHLAQLAKAAQRLGDAAAVYRAGAAFHPWDLDFDARVVTNRALDKVGRPEGFRPLRVALLSTFTTSPLEPCLKVGALRLGLDLDLWVADFDQLRTEIMNPESELYRHDPEVVILATTHRDLERGRDADSQVASWLGLHQQILERTKAHVLQHNFDRPLRSAFGHLDARQAESLRNLASDVNRQLAAQISPRVSLVDYDQCVYAYGAERFCDPRQWHWAKEAVSPAAAPALVEEYLAVLSALTGKTKKVLVLDLDNTMWGGIVGEDGVAGLKVGPPSVEGEAHQALQNYAKALKERGVLLAVASKNNPADAREPFQQLDDMVLKETDFVAFEASWDPKPERLKVMAKALNLGLDSFVFVDDNPAERAMMRRQLKDVLTIPLGSDPSAYVPRLHQARAFEVLALSEEDLGRTEQYRAEASRVSLKSDTGSLEDYYRSLEMVATIRSFAAPDLTRIVQLAARSNQFNLTTWRLSAGDVESLMGSANHATRTIRLRDRFGDYGLVSVIIAEQQGPVLDVAAWFMSCRVIGRTVEEMIVAELDAIAAERSCSEIRGRYLPTKKNGLVEKLYERLGFQLVTNDAGATTWRRVVGPERVKNPFIAVERPV